MAVSRLKKRTKSVILVSPLPVDSYPPVANHAVALASRGFSVYIITSPRRYCRSVDFEFPGVKIKTFRYSSPYRIVRAFSVFMIVCYLWGIRRFLRGRLSLEINYDPIGIVLGGRAGRVDHFLVHHYHEVPFLNGANRHEKRALAVLNLPDVVAVADAYRGVLLEGLNPCPKRVLAIRNLPLASHSPHITPERFAQFRAVYFGAMGESQCLDLIVRSMIYWPAEIHLHLYGEPTDSFRSYLEGLAKEVGSAGRLHFEGWVPAKDLIRTVARYHLGFAMLAPLNDNWRFSAGASNKRFQLMCAGVPQVTDNGIGVPELVEANGVGVCVPPDNLRAIADAVIGYYASPERVEREGLAGRRLIAEHLNMESEFEKLLAEMEGGQFAC